MKQLKLRPNIADHDLNTKIRQMLKFLEKNQTISIIMLFKGREITHWELGRNVLEKIQTGIGSNGKCIISDKLKGTQLNMSIQPYLK